MTSATGGRDGSRAAPSVVVGALATGAALLSGATVLGISGALAALGHDGLSLLLGLSGGLLISGMLVAPHVRRAGFPGLLPLIGARFGLVARVAAAVVLATTVTVLLAAEIQALGMASAMLTGHQGSETTALAALAVLLAALAFRAPGVTRLQAVVFPALAAILALPVMLPALAASGVPIPQLTFGSTLQAVSQLELKLLGEEIADPVTLKPYLRPFTTMTQVGGLMLTLSIALGVACLPHVLARPSASASVHQSRLMVALAAVLVMLAALAMPPVAAAVRHGVMSEIAGREVIALDPWLTTSGLSELGRLGLLQICSVDAGSAEAVIAACAALPDAPARLRLDDIVLAQDAALLALPALAGLPGLVAKVIAGMIAFASLAAAAFGLVALAGEFAPAARRQDAASEAPDGIGGEAPARGGVGAMLARSTAIFLVPLAAYWVSTGPGDLVTLLTSAFSLAAAGLAPALLAAIWWSRATPAAAFLAIVTGFAMTGYYLVATRYFAPQFYETWGLLSNAGISAIADFEAARDALAAASDAERPAALAALHAEAARVANWWGIKPAASGVLGAAVGTFVLVLASALTPRSTAAEQEVVSRLRGGEGILHHHIRRWHWRR